MLEIREEEPRRFQVRNGNLAEHLLVESREVGHAAAESETAQRASQYLWVLGGRRPDDNLIDGVIPADLLDLIDRSQDAMAFDDSSNFERLQRDVADELIAFRHAIATALRREE